MGCILGRLDLLPIFSLPNKGMLMGQLQHVLVQSAGDLQSSGCTGFPPVLPKEHARAVLFVTAVELLSAV